MTTHQDVLGLVDPRRQTRRTPVVGMEFLHQGAMRPRDLIARSALLKPQNLIGFILGHRARPALTGVSAPRVALTMSCLTPAGKPAVHISL